ncbi:MAG TPA: hypothetical protein VMP01_16040 [Pirellulaceae bacterium]|nr:hypothetical protein [Pirellulaceae bacterium]
MGLGVLASLQSWRGRLSGLAEWLGLAHELAPVPDGRLVTRPFRLVVALWVLWGIYAYVKLYHGNLPPNWPGIYVAILGGLYLVWRVAREERVQRRLLICLDESDCGLRIADCGLNSSIRNPQSAIRNWFWPVAGLLLLAANLALLEYRHSYTFTHDDNLSQFLPVILQSCRGFFDDGAFPTFNPHQYAGSPTASLGTYALTYPPTYASFAFARWVLGDENATIEVFGIAHLLAGYCTMFWAGRTIGLRPALAAAGGLCFALCGFFLIGGRSWYYMLPLATWLPLVAIAIWRLGRGPIGWRWVIGTGLLLGILFHAGNAQMWIYAVSFIGLAGVYVVLYGGQSWRIMAAIACATGLGLAIAMPLFLPQYLETAQLKRFAGGEPIVRGLFGLLAPWPLSFADRPGMAETSNIRFTTQFYYAGTVFTAASAIGLFSCAVYRWPRRVVTANVLLAMGLVAFIYALGRPGMAWGLTGELPVFKQFRHPMKYLAFVHLFGILGGGLILERLLKRYPQPRLDTILAGACAVLMSYHTFLALPAFFSWGIRPYPEAPQWLADLAADGNWRIYPVAPRRSTAENYELSQMNHLPTVYGKLCLTGYDPLIEENPQHLAVRQRLIADPLAALRAYGVKYLVLYPTQDLPPMPRGHSYFRWYFWEPPERAAYQANWLAGRLVHWTAGAAVYEIDSASPLAFSEDDPTAGLRIHFDVAGARVRLRDGHRGAAVTINIVPARFFHAYVDGKRVPWQTDEWGRLKLAAPAGAKSIWLRYSPPWLAGTLLGLVLAAASCGGYAAFQRRFPDTESSARQENR